MLKRLLLVGFICVALGSRAAADSLTAQLFPLTGEIRLRNTSASPVPFVYYSISSASGALNSGAWYSIEDTYDASATGFVDPNGEWVELSASSTQLAEGALDADGGRLPARRLISLGSIWTPGPQDPLFDIRTDTEQISVTVDRTLDGDYFSDDVVNQLDYTVWRQNLGSTTLLDADGNLNGVVDAADYVIWRQNYGNSLPGSGLAQSGGGLVAGYSIPEPAAIGMALIGCASLALRRKCRS